MAKLGISSPIITIHASMDATNDSHLCLVSSLLRTSYESPRASAREPYIALSDTLCSNAQDNLDCRLLTPLYASSCRRLDSYEASLLSALGSDSRPFAACLGGIFQYTLSPQGAGTLTVAAANAVMIG